MQDTLTSKDEQLANLQATRAPSSVDEEEEGMRSERQDGMLWRVQWWDGGSCLVVG